MLYREFGRTGEMLSQLGFGAMRLPLINGDDSRIDEAIAIPMVRKAIDNGLNYLDTAWPYHGGNSEAFCAKVMADGYRDKVKIATKSPVWDVKTIDDFNHFLDRQLERLQVECIDFYLLHALKVSFWDNCRQGDYKSFLDKAKADGKIKYAGFSFHDNLDLFKEIVDDYDWDFCQIQLNYMDEAYQGGLLAADYARERGMGVIVMEPLRGGTLAKTELPDELRDIWNKADKKRTPAEWALKYLWNLSNVDVVLSGMGEMWQVEENMRIASETPARSLTSQETALIDEARDFFHRRMVVDCTNCRYCMPCPVGVDIPENFWALNHDSLFNDPGKADFWINGWLGDPKRASNCVDCGQCETHCPQNIEIMKHLKMVNSKYIQKV